MKHTCVPLILAVLSLCSSPRDRVGDYLSAAADGLTWIPMRNYQQILPKY